MEHEVPPVSRRLVRLIVVLLGLIVVGIAALLVVLLTGNGETDVVTEDTSPVTGTILEDLDPAGPSIPDDVDPGGGSAPGATPVPARMTLERVAAEVDRLWPGSISAQRWGVDAVEGWTCVPNTDGALVSGSVATCRPDPPVVEGQHPVVTVLVLDGAGRVAVAEAGVQNPDLSPESMHLNVESGLNCTRFTNTDPGPANIDDPLRYFAAVLYWFLEGRPSPLMDIDENDIPCETKFTADVVAGLWSGGWLPPAPPEPAGQPVDGPVQDGDVLSVFGVAHDDTLNVRARPGADQPVVSELAPTDEVVATGRAWALSDSIWYEVRTGPGWVNSDYVAFAGDPLSLPGDEVDLRAKTVTELGQLFVDRMSRRSLPRPPSRVVVSVAPTDNEITYDLVGIGSDRTVGLRIQIMARSLDGDYAVDRIVETSFCARDFGRRRGSFCR
ncbi:MAG: SH3 domain-containing protein [Acidimicrobiia bacterium]|nr:SH3 domain-containing protein [Acidimicrobiia bacterium]